jgi:alkylation response protein AidB-like acyl-CoA dehydrogenase
MRFLDVDLDDPFHELWQDALAQGFFARLLPSAHEVVWGAAEALEHPHATELAIAGSLGALIAYALLYALGRLLRTLPPRISTEGQQAYILRITPRAWRILPCALLFAPSAIGPLIVTSAGFFGLSRAKTIYSLVVAEILFRAIMLTF